MNLSRLTLAQIFGFLGSMLTVFMILVYYMHLYALPDVSIEAVRFIASTHSAAVGFFAFSLGGGIASLVGRKERKASWVMLVSTVTAGLGYFFPSIRLWILGYLVSLIETLTIAIVHLTLLVSSFRLLKLK